MSEIYSYLHTYLLTYYINPKNLKGKKLFCRPTGCIFNVALLVDQRPTNIANNTTH